MLKSKITFFIAVLFCINSLAAYVLKPPVTVNVTDWHSVEAYLNQEGKTPAEVKSVVLKKRQLSAIPAWVFEKTKNIKILNVSDNAITEIPPAIGSLTKLEMLFLGHNHIHSVDFDIQKATHLKWIELEDNKLSSIPEGVYHLSRLGKLFIDTNNISEISSNIGRLRNLFLLSLSQNPLRVFPPEIGQLSALRTLDLGETRLVRLPKEIESLKGKIRSLSLDGIKNFAETDRGGAIGKRTLVQIFGSKVQF